MKIKWRHIIREAHRQWARRLMMGGAFMRCRSIGVEWNDFRVTNWYRRWRAY